MGWDDGRGETGGRGKFVVMDETNGGNPGAGRGEGHGDGSDEEASMVGRTYKRNHNISYHLPTSTCILGRICKCVNKKKNTCAVNSIATVQKK